MIYPKILSLRGICICFFLKKNGDGIVDFQGGGVQYFNSDKPFFLKFILLPVSSTYQK
jgi:hypothetical protein